MNELIGKANMARLAHEGVANWREMQLSMAPRARATEMGEHMTRGPGLDTVAAAADGKHKGEPAPIKPWNPPPTPPAPDGSGGDKHTES